MINLPSGDALLTVEDLAREFGLSVSSIYKWNHSGRGPRRHRAGKRVYYRLSDVEAWINSREVLQ